MMGGETHQRQLGEMAVEVPQEHMAYRSLPRGFPPVTRGRRSCRGHVSRGPMVSVQ